MHTQDPTLNDAMIMWLLLTGLGTITVIVSAAVALVIVIRFLIYAPISGVNLIYVNYRRFRIWCGRNSK